MRTAPAPAPRSLSRQVRDSMSPVQTEALVRSCRIVRVQRRMGVRSMHTAQLACSWAWSCSFIHCCSVMMAPRVLAICSSCCWSESWNSCIRCASVQCTTWLQRASLVVVWCIIVTMSCSRDICSSRRAAGVAAHVSSSVETSSVGVMFSSSS